MTTISLVNSFLSLRKIPNFFRSETILGLKKNLVPKNLGVKKFLDQNFCTSKQFLDPKNYFVGKFLDPKLILSLHSSVLKILGLHLGGA